MTPPRRGRNAPAYPYAFAAIGLCAIASLAITLRRALGIEEAYEQLVGLT